MDTRFWTGIAFLSLVLLFLLKQSDGKWLPVHFVVLIAVIAPIVIVRFFATRHNR